MPGRAMPRPCATSPRRVSCGPASFSAHQGLLAPERRLLPADRPPEPCLDRRDVEADVLPVQRVAHLGAQGVAGTEAAGGDPVLLAGGHQRVPEGDGAGVLARPARSRARRCSRCGRPRPRARRTTRRRRPCSRGRPAGRARRAPRRSAAPGPPARRGSGAGPRSRDPRRRPPRAAVRTSSVLAALGTSSTWSSAWR